MKNFILFALISSLLLGACSDSDVETMASFGNEIQDYSVTNQNDETFEREDMEGQVWLLDFIFTNCATVCPPMTANMTHVTQELEERGIEDYGVLSFTVDPDNDTPEALADYLSYYDVPEETEWHLMTGYDYDFIRSFAEQNFKTIVAPPPSGSNQVTHGTSFYLIDADGKIRKSYPGLDTGDTSFPVNEIVDDVSTLTAEKDSD
ncbi:SCO family protein [Lacicoccus alkaliphilus]|uniref:Protein SCO1/2 n=1 Tax=Lacicoccus alkaliphilus DSM 16010 TaxID=1123231 RepID=A0A1M7BWZ9_9BACL|nr:SCO family protein [Salinicoccus alkaliphilus]SHL59457.1 protein SCO1/2 [Salinicoccus alkaliphilus DSM 16010]